MPNNPFDRTPIGTLERPLSADFNRNWSQSDRTVRAVLHQLFSSRSLSSSAGVASTGFIGDGFRIVPTSPIGLSVQLTAGLGFFYAPTDVPSDIGATDLAGVDDRSSYKPMLLTAPQQFAVPAAPGAGNSRIDIIEARYSRQLVDPQTRRQLDPVAKAFAGRVFNKTLTFVLDGQTGTVTSPAASTAALSYKVGVVAATGSQVEPSVTAGYVQVARINVGPSVTTIDGDALVDRRPLLNPGGFASFRGAWRLQWNSGTPIATVLALEAPPGISVGLNTSGLRGGALIIVSGGQITGGSIVVSGDFSFATDSFATLCQFDLGSAVLQTATTNHVPNTFTPSFLFGVGTAYLRATSTAHFVTNTGASNVTDTTLEDCTIHASGTIRYTL